MRVIAKEGCHELLNPGQAYLVKETDTLGYFRVIVPGHYEAIWFHPDSFEQ